ncbi:MAG: phosphoglycolate phosphatase-like HAD superfamily hydrolase [Pirellulaceae bacterium]|jgi:phosphoglycolate phosphatase-like HAD superfamily hydrolase
MDIRWNEQWLEASQQQNAPLQDKQLAHDTASTQLSNIIFDFSGVLYDNSSWRRWLIQQLSRIGVHTQYELFFRLWECDYLPRPKEGLDYWHSLQKYLLAIGLNSGQAFELTLAAKSRCEQTMRQLRPFPGVAKTLHVLAARGVRMDVVCSCHWSETEVHSRLQRMGLQRFFHSVNCLSKNEDLDISELIQETTASHGEVRHHSALVARTPRPLEAAQQLGLVAIAFNQTNDCVASIHLDRIDVLLVLTSVSPNSRRLAG